LMVYADLVVTIPTVTFAILVIIAIFARRDTV